MGQYYKIVNLDKKQYMEPWTFDDGAKLLEFGMSAEGTMTALAILLADGNGRGGGDLNDEPNPLVGSWAGDRIVISGDYADEGRFTDDKENLYHISSEQYLDIGPTMLKIMKNHKLVRKSDDRGFMRPDMVIVAGKK
jgi:hypothetical protein